MPKGGFHLTPCEVLAVAKNATGEEAGRARNRLAALVHPDRAGPEAQAIMQLLNHAAEAVAQGQGLTPYVFGGPEFRENNSEDKREDRREDRREENREAQRQQRERETGRNRTKKCRCGRNKKPEYDTCFACSPIDLCPFCKTRYYNAETHSACKQCNQQEARTRRP